MSVYLNIPLGPSPRDPVPIMFSAEDRKLIDTIGYQRFAAKVVVGIPDMNRSYQRNAEGMRIAFAAELALCRLLGLEPDLQVGPKGSHGIHATWEECACTDPTCRQPRLTFNASYISKPHYDLKYSQVPPADVFMLFCGDKHVMWCAGGISRQRFAEVAKIAEFGHGPRHHVHQRELAPAYDILKWKGRPDRVASLRSVYQSRLADQPSLLGGMWRGLPMVEGVEESEQTMLLSQINL